MKTGQGKFFPCPDILLPYAGLCIKRCHTAQASLFLLYCQIIHGFNGCNINPASLKHASPNGISNRVQQNITPTAAHKTAHGRQIANFKTSFNILPTK